MHVLGAATLRGRARRQTLKADPPMAVEILLAVLLIFNSILLGARDSIIGTVWGPINVIAAGRQCEHMADRQKRLSQSTVGVEPHHLEIGSAPVAAEETNGSDNNH